MHSHTTLDTSFIYHSGLDQRLAIDIKTSQYKSFSKYLKTGDELGCLPLSGG